MEVAGGDLKIYFTPSKPSRLGRELVSKLSAEEKRSLYLKLRQDMDEKERVNNELVLLLERQASSRQGVHPVLARYVDLEFEDMMSRVNEILDDAPPGTVPTIGTTPLDFTVKSMIDLGWQKVATAPEVKSAPFNHLSDLEEDSGVSVRVKNVTRPSFFCIADESAVRRSEIGLFKSALELGSLNRMALIEYANFITGVERHPGLLSPRRAGDYIFVFGQFKAFLRQCVSLVRHGANLDERLLSNLEERRVRSLLPEETKGPLLASFAKKLIVMSSAPGLVPFYPLEFPWGEYEERGVFMPKYDNQVMIRITGDCCRSVHPRISEDVDIWGTLASLSGNLPLSRKDERILLSYLDLLVRPGGTRMGIARPQFQFTDVIITTNEWKRKISLETDDEDISELKIVIADTREYRNSIPLPECLRNLVDSFLTSAPLPYRGFTPGGRCWRKRSARNRAVKWNLKSEAEKDFIRSKEPLDISPLNWEELSMDDNRRHAVSRRERVLPPLRPARRVVRILPYAAFVRAEWVRRFSPFTVLR